MAPINEIEAMREVEKALLELGDSEARKRVLIWACSKFSPSGLDGSVERMKAKVKSKKAGLKKTGKQCKSKKTSYKIIKDLNLSQKGKIPFRDFFVDKLPKKSNAKIISLLAVYYLKKILAIAGISADHIYTCFKDIAKPVPSNLNNHLQQIASVRGWIDTSHMDDIGITTVGENYVEHKLPPHKKEAGK